MSLYAIGDFHLSFTVHKPMDVFDKRWKNHVVKIEKYWKKKVTAQDTVVITGDHSWGRNLEECQADLDFIMALPGRKILLRGNHDMFWDAKKTEKLNEMFRGKLEFLCGDLENYEFITPQSTDNILCPAMFLHGKNHFIECLIAPHMTKHII